jgi:hypothetical protein
MLLPALSSALPLPPLYTYLCDSVWELTKRHEYHRGGAFGTWTGQARFTPTSSFGSFHLLYTEEGSIVFDGAKTSFESAGRPLCYDCAASKCYFVESSSDAASEEEILSLRFFHDLPMGTFTFDDKGFEAAASEEPTSFEHLCVRDLYTGKFLIQDKDHFEILWSVEGPSKQGSVDQTFTRIVTRGAEGVP